MRKKRTVNFVLLGLGKLGTGFYKLWLAKKEQLLKDTGWDLQLKKILIKNPNFKRPGFIDKSLLTNRPDDILKDETIKIAVDAIGGIEPTYSLIKSLIEHKIHLVSANRAMLAARMHDLADLANKNRIHILVEPALGGGVPIISALQRDLVANRKKSLTGILSGTSNYILSQMTEKGSTLKEVLRQKELQNMGETLSIVDYEGSDAAQKVAILAASSFGIDLNYLRVHAEGISQVTPLDIAYAHKFGFEFKLLAIIREHEDSFEIRVHPTLVPKGHPLTLVRGEYNAYFVETDLMGTYMIYGKGVGIESTGSLMLRDIIALSNMIYNFKRKANYVLNWQKKPVLPMADIVSSYYVRYVCLNQPGVIGQITKIFGEFNINLSSAHAEVDNASAPGAGIVHIFVDEARERDVLQALDKIQTLDIVQSKTKFFRILS